MIQNRPFTLEHLQQLVNKYTVIQDSSRQWRTEIWKNWKKIKWTREGGDLAKLQQNLGVHINSLNLAVAVMNRESTEKVGDQVQDVQSMLGEIHDWFTINLRGRSIRSNQSMPSYTVWIDLFDTPG
ncbi:hypothetical protein ASPWEDRAFT_22956 [Aspergillus wentii DTO 134E9]|uniref:Uncharacterized protein n=1 Tax=Aspergillus wentii DTO 134E9 TaxID=1073089 RepID=A0A1L9S0X9_ASPWE|nr:uncharacterized protein ASPWEDRAFT_22956 [Aspergillus wentii DTO 134E9]OJJ40809.1 hypothetical protein ASPWEDRAFT_22956 [Aspergillus wentii DTO 134E9]